MRSSEFNWPAGLFLLTYHAILLVMLPLYFIFFTPNWPLIGVAAILMYITGLSVTALYHRLYSHPTYKINPVVETVLLFFATMATQGSALRWSFEHRHHHAFVDTDRDPYSIKKGFWYAHFLWLFEKPKEIDSKVVSDLIRKPMLRFQERHYPILMFITNALSVLVAGWWFNDYLGAFLFVWLTRMFFLHHFTWFINSLAHTWGARTFCQELSAVDNYIIALLTFGEGYHNYHHTFAYDYRNGIRWFHFDPTKWLIWTLSKLGLARELKTVHRYRIEEKLLIDRKEIVLEKIQSTMGAQKEEWETKITTLIDSVLTKFKQLRELKEQYRKLKKPDIKVQIKALKKSLKAEYRKWMMLYRDVLASQTQ